MEQYATAAGGIARGGAGGMAAERERPPRLELLAGALEEALNELGALGDQIHSQIDRLAGSQPTPVPEKLPTARNQLNEIPPQSTIHRLEQAAGLLRSRLHDFMTVRERLKAL